MRSTRLFLIIIVLSLFMLAGCDPENQSIKKSDQQAPKPTREGWIKIFNGWIGKDINSLIERWVYPDRDFVAPNGNKVYIFYLTRQGYLPSININTGEVTLNPHQFYCTMFIEVNQYGTIIRYNFKGDDCVAYE